MDQATEKIAVVGARLPLSMLGQLSLWIERELPGWEERGVSVLMVNGVTIHPVIWAGFDANRPQYHAVYVGEKDSCLEYPPDESKFVKVDIDPEMSYVHAMVLIETAVEGKAGR